MKTFLILLFGLFLAGYAEAQAPVAPSSPAPLTPEALDQLVGPIALYPDSLVALILPASTVPSDIVLASRYLTGNGDPAQIPNQPWDDSVKSLTSYPELLQWLNQNIGWTTQLGNAFLTQPADVMDAIQQLRAKAMAAGNLVNTPQQLVSVDNGDVSIVPANDNALYVPEYDANDVYDDGYDNSSPLIAFGPAWPVGPWLSYGIDWHHRGIYRGDWRAAGDYRGRGGGNAYITNAHPWQPNSGSVRRAFRGANAGALSRPNPLPGVIVPQGTRRAGYQSAAPAAVPYQEAPRGGMFDGYGRGSNAREASIRGQLSRQPPPVVEREVAPQQINRAPAAEFSRPAPERVERSFAPRAEAPAGAFHMSAGPAAAAFSARGAESRGGGGGGRR